MHTGRRVAEANKREMQRRLAQFADALAARQPTRLANSLLILIEGAYAISQTLGGPDAPGRELLESARALIVA